MTRGFVTMTLGVKTLVLRAIPIALRGEPVPARVITLGERDNNVDSASESETEARQNDDDARDNETCVRHLDASASDTDKSASGIKNERSRTSANHRVPRNVRLSAGNCQHQPLRAGCRPELRHRLSQTEVRREPPVDGCCHPLRPLAGWGQPFVSLISIQCCLLVLHEVVGSSIPR